MLIEHTASLIDRHIQFVANGFYVLAAALGLPSLTGFLYFGWAALRMRMLTPSPATAGSSPNSAVQLIETGAKIFGAAFRLLGAAGEWVATALTIIFFVALMAALTLFLTARGLHADAAWARTLAGVVSAGFLVVSFGAMLALGRGLAPLPALTAAGCVYTLCVLLGAIR